MKRATAPCDERGSALVLALFVLVLLTAMGTALLFLGLQETKMSQASLRAKSAFYLAEAGAEDGRMTLLASNSDDDLDDDLLAAAGPNGVLDFDPATLQVTYDAAGDVTGIGGYGDDQPLRLLTRLGLAADRGWYSAFLGNDPLDGRANLDDSNSRVLITALGAGRERSIEQVQIIVEPYRFLPATPAAAITLLGPAPVFDNGTGSSQAHGGDDCGISGGAFAPIVGTVGAAARAQVQGDLSFPGSFTSGGFVGADTVADLTDAADPIVAAAGHGTIDPTWTDCAALTGMIRELADEADHYCDADLGTCTWPTTGGSDDVVFIDGDLAGTPSGTFAGILVVTGALTFDAHTIWDGIVLVVGSGEIHRNGNAAGGPAGSLIVANIDPTPGGAHADKSDWCSAGFSPARYDTNGSSDSAVEWCRAKVADANPTRTFRVVDFAQR